MLDIYLEILKNEIKKSDLVKNNTFLKANEWNKSCYEQLSKIISQRLNTILNDDRRLKMGTTISARTLSNIFKGTYKTTYPLDPRTLNTLSKLVLFLNFSNWESFVKYVASQQVECLKKAPPEQQLVSFLKEAIKIEFDVYNLLPEVDELSLEPYYIKEQSAFKRIMDTLMSNFELNRVLSNSYNPSSYEILEVEILEITEKTAKVKTEEYWLLCWWDSSKGKYVKRFKDISDHYYILLKRKGKWIIKTNATTSDINAIDVK